MSNIGKTVRVHYRGWLDDGTPLGDSRARGAPLEFVCGAGQMPPAIDEAARGLRVGQAVTVRVPPEEAYGPRREDLVMRFPAELVPNASEVRVGDAMAIARADGQPLPARVVAADEDGVVVDANHWLAGRALNLRVELIEVREDV